MIIGITGKNCAGKDTAADYLRQKGFSYLSLSDAIRDELTALGIELTRENLIAHANKMRRKHGSNVFAKRICDKVELDKDYVIVSIRNPGEVEQLRELEDFILVNIDANSSSRFERMKSRCREGDPKTLEDFERVERAEAKNAVATSQQLDEVIAMADNSIENNSSPQELYAKLERLLQEIKSV